MNEESTYQRLVEQGYSESQIRMILELAGLEGDTTRATEQLELAKALRRMNSPEGRQAGNVYVASNPLEHIGDVGNYYAGTRNMQTLYGEQKRIQDEQMRRRLEYLKAGQAAPAASPYKEGWTS